MANTKKAPEVAPEKPYDIWEDKVTFKIPRTKERKDDVPVYINGRPFAIQRGVWVDLPRPVFEVLRDQEEAELARESYIEGHEIKDKN